MAAVNQLSDGKAPGFLRPFLAGGVSIALKKGGSGVRPLCCGDPLRRLVSKCYCLGASEEIAHFFHNKNFGVGCPGGVEVVSHSLREVLRKHAQSELALLKIDFSNVFNRVDRKAFMRATSTSSPGCPTGLTGVTARSRCFYDHSEIIESTSEQGDPLAPFYFCLALRPLVEEIAALGPEYQKWYMDDGGIVASADVLIGVWEILHEKDHLLDCF